MARQSSRRLWAAKLDGKGLPAALATPLMTAAVRPHGLLLGIDPSLRGCGFAVVDAGRGGRLRLVASRTLKLSTKLSMVQCLGAIARATSEMLDAHVVTHVAVEETIYVQNFRTAQILGAARGAAIGAAAARDLPVAEYPPLRIKQAVAGFGRASKEQVAKQMQALLGLPEALSFDESDAAAVAVCHAYTWRGGAIAAPEAPTSHG
ncbi:MAG: crossover junction endodeoxyribonuclease RuvC [Verrucomicrobiota bacterium]